MGQIAHQLPIGLGLLVQALFAGYLELLVDHPEFGQKAGGRLIDRRNHARHRYRLAASRRQQQFLGTVTPAASQRLLQRQIPFRTALKQAMHRLSKQVSETGLDQAFGGRIAVDHPAIAVEQENCGGQ